MTKLNECKLESNSSNRIFAYRYKGLIRELIIQYKFYDKAYLSKLFSKLLLKNKKICNMVKKCDIIIPVPLHKKRKLERGYNQTYLILKEMSNKMELKIKKNVLKKIKNIKPQSEKNMQQRKEDIKGVFIVKNTEQIIGKQIILFDDVYTTGSTCKECKKVLLNAGAKNVIIFALAKD